MCKGIGAYEIFTKAIMTPWTELVVGEGKERRGVKSKKKEIEE